MSRRLCLFRPDLQPLIISAEARSFQFHLTPWMCSRCDGFFCHGSGSHFLPSTWWLGYWPLWRGPFPLMGARPPRQTWLDELPLGASVPRRLLCQEPHGKAICAERELIKNPSARRWHDNYQGFPKPQRKLFLNSNAAEQESLTNVCFWPGKGSLGMKKKAESQGNTVQSAARRRTRVQTPLFGPKYGCNN